jgi:hypothetical protein
LWLWKETKKLEFVKTGNVSVLEQECDRVAPKQGCALVLDRIRKAENRIKALHIEQSDWGNCVGRLIEQQVGSYPEQEWNSFLRNYGIQKHIMMNDPDK